MSALHCTAGYGVGLKVESTGTGDPLPGLMGNEGSSDPFSPEKSPSAPAQLHGRRLSLCLVNYQPAPAFTVVHTQVAR